MVWFVLAVLSALFAALVPIFAKIGLAEVDSSVATVTRAIVMTILIVVFVLSIGKGGQLTQLTSRDTGFIILSGIAGALSWLCYFAALKLADVSKVAPIDRASLIIAIVFAVLVLGEKITLVKGLAAVLIFAGILLLAIYPA
jgi:transporter family protein